MTAATGLMPGSKAAMFQRVTVLWLWLVILLSFALTVYTVAMWRIALPSFDVVDYHAFLAEAVVGHVQWDTLWQRHNGVHLIALPKLLWVLDLWLVHGRGWLVTAVSALAVLATLLLLRRQVTALTLLSPAEQALFNQLCALVLTSVLMAECLLSPVNCQWSLLALGVVLLASGVQAVWWQGQRAGYLPALLGALLAYLSAGPFSVLLLALCVSLLLVSRQDVRAVRRGLAWGVPALVVLVVGWECMAWSSGQPLLLAALYRQFAEADKLAQVEPFIRANAGIYPGWLLSRLVFMGQYLLLTLGKHWQPAWWLAVVFVGWVVAVIHSVARWQRQQWFFVFLLCFALMLGVGAAVMRVTTLYDYRHANIGFLLGFASLVLVYSGIPAHHRLIGLQTGLLCYSVLFLWAAVTETGAWAWEGRNQIREQQIGAAVGVQDPAMFAYVWKHDDANAVAVEHDRAVFRDHRMGIYASEGYRRFAGDIPLPARQVNCEYVVTVGRQHYPDPQAFVVRGKTVAEDGAVMTQVLFRDENGRHLGWALAQLPSDRLLEQWSGTASWGGHLRFRDDVSVQRGASPAGIVQLVAFDRQRQCQPYRLVLPVE